MSTELTTATGSFTDVTVESFSGGKDRGQCIQLTQRVKPLPSHLGHIPFDNIKLDVSQAQELMRTLQMWLNEDSSANAFDEPGDNTARTHPWAAATRF